MRKYLSILMTLAFCLAAGSVWAHHGPITVKIDAAAKKQPGVTFPHAEHAKRIKECDTCHHTNKGLVASKDKDVKKCSGCHLDPEGKVPSMREMSMTKNPMHIRCVGCHKEMKKGPTVCKDCHKK